MVLGWETKKQLNLNCSENDLNLKYRVEVSLDKSNNADTIALSFNLKDILKQGSEEYEIQVSKDAPKIIITPSYCPNQNN